MRLLTFLLLINLPLLCWANPLQYNLEVEIDIEQKTLAGIVHLKSSEDKTIQLSIKNITSLKINHKETNLEQDLWLDTIANQEIIIHYQANLTDETNHFVNSENVFLTGNWYPQPNELTQYQLAVTLPNGFLATSETETSKIQGSENNSIFKFKVDHPLDKLTLAASKNYVLKTDQYKDVLIEAYFFKKDIQLIDTYIDYTKKYLAIYEEMLTPYPYKRFAIVENVLPTGYSMPTYTLLGSTIIHLPFIVETSLGHEILHQWFGNSVFVDYQQGNWVEGITNYLADHCSAENKNLGDIYRKQILLNYNAYVNKDNAMPVKDFRYRQNKAQQAIGYGKTAMLFHTLKQQYGKEIFFNAWRKLIQNYSFKTANWDNIQTVFEELTGDSLSSYFTQWVINRQDIPNIAAENVKLSVQNGKIVLSFDLIQKNAPYYLKLPVYIYTHQNKEQRIIEISSEHNLISLILDQLPTRVVIDENYDVMRQLVTKEIPPIIASLMGKRQVIVVATEEQMTIYQPLIKAFAIQNTHIITPEKLTFAQLKEHSIIIAGINNTVANMLFGKQLESKQDIWLRTSKNPYNDSEVITILYAKNRDVANAISRKIGHYGKYTELAFNQGKNTLKTIAESTNGIPIFARLPNYVLQPQPKVSLSEIIPNIMDKRIIYIGEQHDQFAHHINQLHIIKTLHQAGHDIAVGMEMFSTSVQKVIDAYIAGQLDEKVFLEQSHYFENWGFDYNLYKPIIDYLKANNIPLIGLNMEKRIIDQIADQGIHSLVKADNIYLPDELDLSDETYKDDLYEVFLVHKKHFGHDNFAYFLQTQVIWDETMAQTAHQFLVEQPNSKLIVLAGNGHVMYQYGIPNRLQRRNNEAFTVITQDSDTELGIADYVVITETLAGQQAPKLGIFIDKEAEQVVIKEVGSDTPAEKAGLKQGDIISELDGKTINTIADLKLVLFYTKIETTVKIIIIRDNQEIPLQIELFEAKPKKKH
ncbi:MAG: ChaN family lipoprotein [Thiomargarita sp.]|nr:ChaN family lipoprotein [Thiomargarita sp.]